MGNPIPVSLSQECRKATQILNDFVDPVNGLDRVLPLSVLRKAKGFAIFSVFRIGFVLSARAGSGVVIVKTDDGKWSAPAAIGIGGLGGGFNVGAEVTDFLIVLNSRSAVRSFMATGSLQLGGNLSLAVGPLGRSAEASGSVNSSGKLAAMFSYSRSKGLYGGVSVEGTVLIDREDANGKAYGRNGHTAKQILSGSVDVPAFAQGLISTIERFTLAHTPVGDLDHNPYDDEDFFRYGDRGRDRPQGSGRNRDRDRDSLDSDSLHSRDPSAAAASTAAGMSWSERREQYQNGGASGASRKQGTGKHASDLLEDDFDRLGISDPPRRSSESWTEADRRRRNEAETRNLGSYAFGSPISSISNAPPRTGSGASVRKRPGIRQRSSSIASNLSFGSFGRKKSERTGSTPIPDSSGADVDVDVDLGGRRSAQREPLDSLDRELQSGSFGGGGSSSAGYRGSSYRPSHSGRSPSYGGPLNSGALFDAPASATASSSASPFRQHRTNSSMSVTGRHGWSTFDSGDGDGDGNGFGGGRHGDFADDDLFGGARKAREGSTATSDPFADLTAGLERKWTGTGPGAGRTPQLQPKWDGGYAGSTMRGISTLGATNVPQPTASPSSAGISTSPTSTRRRSGIASRSGTTPTIPESHGDDVNLIGDDDDFVTSSSNGGGGGERVVALYDFEAQQEGDLGFQRGQVIGVTKKTRTRDDWWQGRVEVGGLGSRIGM
ncbi:related to YSC84 - protein involved in the organization of actin cytoskeleton [Pseudozyma flocculosa]|uniref:Related to YSC84 - protein involved in the organization of actin cytoskeleton n=1 Tax=Pseudozyma flocculosa TaxID=84751 RepID=A0A5C3F4R1_9BASI|nr:related to YSC84 - protein involved in the organization of actin cytoskeleton [Pseudozyma flocculosa]